MNKNMKEIKYKDVMDLGFKETFSHDNVYFNQYGYEYSIVELKLTKHVFIDWEKSSRICTMIRINNKEECSIMARYEIQNLRELKDIIDFFIDKKSV